MPGLIGGYGNYLFPLELMILDLIFRRVNVFSYWVLPPAFFFIWTSFFTEGGAGTGWTLYPPLRCEGQITLATDIILFSLHFSGVSSISRSLNFMTTGIESRKGGIDWSLIGLFGWCIIVTVFLLILSIPVLACGVTINLFDRNVNRGFFKPQLGGNVLMFQHLFWFFGHPEVYVLIAPAFGLVGMACQLVSSKKVLFSVKALRSAVQAIGYVGCMVWAHHMFTIGMDGDSRAYFRAATC